MALPPGERRNALRNLDAAIVNGRLFVVEGK